MRLCACGCGEPAGVYRMTGKRGQPRRFIHGHNSRGKGHPMWRGGRTKHVAGYWQVRAPDHSRSHNGYVLEHLLVAEKALGKPLPDGAEVHHVNGDGFDNRNANLVVCQDIGYHKLLHYRQQALDACGRAGYVKCEICHEYDDPQRMWVSPTRGLRAYHNRCAARRNRERAKEAK